MAAFHCVLIFFLFQPNRIGSYCKGLKTNWVAQCAWTLSIITILTIIFFNRSLSLLSFSRLQLYNWEALPFTYFDHPMYAFTDLYCIFSFPFSPTGLVPEVPLLQAFENELGRGWTRLIIAILTIVCLCFSLLELSLPLHRMVSNHFPPSFLVTTF